MHGVMVLPRVNNTVAGRWLRPRVVSTGDADAVILVMCVIKGDKMEWCSMKFFALEKLPVVVMRSAGL